MLVFRKDLYFQDESVAKQSDVWRELCTKWAEECDGRTKEELVSEGHIVMDNWCEDVMPVHNPWRTFNEIPVDNPFVLIKIKKYVYRAAYYNKVKGTITTAKGSLSRKEAIIQGLKWKYIEDEEE